MEWSTSGKQQTRTPELGSKVLIPFETDATSSTKSVTVTFRNGVKTDPHQVTVSAGKTSEVACAL